MIRFSENRLKAIFENFAGKKVLVLGDLMLDRYLWGEVSRISPEAPVPVVEITREFSRLGGAANVGNNIRSLGGTPFLVGVIGQDNMGKEVLTLLQERNLPQDGIVATPSRPTTVKTRVIASGQHVVRTDREARDPIDADTRERVKKSLLALIPQMDAVIIEDYNKGLIVPSLIRLTIETAQKHDVPVFVDPKFDNFLEYREATVFKPNIRETEAALGKRLDEENALEEAGRWLLKKLRPRWLLITLGEKGMAIFEENAAPIYVPTRARKVRDVSGAGDTVISTLCMAFIAGANFLEAASLANRAAGLVCEEVGIVPIERDRLFAVLSEEIQAWER